MPTKDLQRWDQDGANMKSQPEAAGYAVDLQYAANDSTALGVANALASSYTGPYPVLTGQDCDIASVKNMLAAVIFDVMSMRNASK